MYTLVIYDISDDNLRQKISDICKKFGLEMLQRSSYAGKISVSQRKSLAYLLKKTLGKDEGNIRIFVICDKDFLMHENIGKEIFEKPELKKYIV